MLVCGYWKSDLLNACKYVYVHMCLHVCVRAYEFFWFNCKWFNI